MGGELQRAGSLQREERRLHRTFKTGYIGELGTRSTSILQEREASKGAHHTTRGYRIQLGYVKEGHR